MGLLLTGPTAHEGVEWSAHRASSRVETWTWGGVVVEELGALMSVLQVGANCLHFNCVLHG
jgi:hypothetical protein